MDHPYGSVQEKTRPGHSITKNMVALCIRVEFLPSCPMVSDGLESQNRPFLHSARIETWTFTGQRIHYSVDPRDLL